LERKAKLFSLAGDPTRLRVLEFMFREGSACVGEIAEALGCSVACVSHHLQILRDNGFLESEKTGTSVCYTLLRESEFTKMLEKLVCSVKVGNQKT